MSDVAKLSQEKSWWRATQSEMLNKLASIVENTRAEKDYVPFTRKEASRLITLSRQALDLIEIVKDQEREIQAYRETCSKLRMTVAVQGEAENGREQD